MRLKKKNAFKRVLIEKYQESLLIARFYYHSSTRSSTILVQMRIYFCSKIMYKVRVTKLHSRHFVSVTRFCCFYRQRLPDSRSFDTQMTKMQINASGQVLDAEMQQWNSFRPRRGLCKSLSNSLPFAKRNERKMRDTCDFSLDEKQR